MKNQNFKNFCARIKKIKYFKIIFIIIYEKSKLEILKKIRNIFNFFLNLKFVCYFIIFITN